MSLLSRFKTTRIGSSISYFIQPRKVSFEWQDTPVDWIPDQPFASYFVNEINNILPAVNSGSAVYITKSSPRSLTKN